MNPNPSDNAAKQPTPTDNQLESVNVAPAPGQKPVPAVNSTEDKAAVPATDKTEVHVSPAEQQKSAGVAADPSTIKLPPAAETLPHKPASAADQQPIQAAPIVPPMAQALPDIENPYILSGEVDRARLVAQARLFRGYLEANATRLIGENVERILDIGCGEGQLTQVFARLYPNAHVVGLDTDERAIEAARRASRGTPNLEYVVADAQVSLPPGPFDVIYESMSLLHMRNPGQVIQLAFQGLKSRGVLWLKEADPRGIMAAFTHPTYRSLVGLLMSSMAKLGSDASIAMKIPELLGKVGFTDLKTEAETYPIGNTSTEARITMASQLGVIYNARNMMSKVQNISVSEVEKMYRALLDVLMAPGGPTGQWPFMNIIARRPQLPQPSTP